MPIHLDCSAVLQVICNIQEPLTLSDQTFVANLPTNQVYTLGNGLAATPSAIDNHYEDPSVVLAPSASKTYTLSSLTDLLSRVIVFADIKLILLKVLSRTAGDHLTIGPGATHGWNPLIPTGVAIPVYTTWDWYVDGIDSLPVTVNSNDQLTITNTGSHPITYKLVLAGNSG